MTEIRQADLNGYEHELLRYCKLITSSEWDAKDLYQIVRIKLFQAELRHKKVSITKAFLFRVATNAWIDICRKNKIKWDELNEGIPEQNLAENALSVLESIEILTERLTPQQVCILLLVDIFLFSPRETAEMVKSTEGAVKALLHRARKHAQDESATMKKYAGALIETFVNAFKRNDPSKIVETFITLRTLDYELTPVNQGITLYFRCKDPEGFVFEVYTENSLRVIIPY